MFIRKFRYHFGAAFCSIGCNKIMGFIAVSTVAFCLILLGISIIFGYNLQYISSQIQSQFEVHAFIDISYSEADARAIESQIKGINGIKTVKFETKEEALQSAKAMFDGKVDALSGLENDNPMRYSYKITLTNIKSARSVATELAKIKGVADVVNRTDILDGITSFAGTAGTISLIGMLAFAIVAISIISNTIKLAVMARRREIEIMKSVGATNWFIRWPFIIEGAIFGLVGGVISFFPVYYGYVNLAKWWSTNLNLFKLMQGVDILNSLLIVFLVFGCVIGSIGSVLSVRKYLKI